jgi:hypothetical protein
MVTLIAASVAMLLSVIIIGGMTMAIVKKRVEEYHMLLAIGVCILLFTGVCIIGAAEQQYLHSLAYH